MIIFTNRSISCFSASTISADVFTQALSVRSIRREHYHDIRKARIGLRKHGVLRPVCIRKERDRDSQSAFSSLCIPRLDLFLFPTDVLLHIDEFQDHGKDDACEHLKTHKSK